MLSSSIIFKASIAYQVFSIENLSVNVGIAFPSNNQMIKVYDKFMALNYYSNITFYYFNKINISSLQIYFDDQYLFLYGFNN